MEVEEQSLFTPASGAAVTSVSSIEGAAAPDMPTSADQNASLETLESNQYVGTNNIEL